jgi:hypothetical protein
VTSQPRIAVGLVELPEIALYDPYGSNRATVRKGSALISKQVLMASLEAGGFDVRLYNLKKGDDEEPYGEVEWRGVRLTKAMVGSSYRRISPSECDVWGLTCNFSQHRNAAALIIRHLRSTGRPVIVGGSDAIAETRFYLEAGADAVVLDKSGAANWAVIDSLTGQPPRGSLSGIAYRDGRPVSLRVRPGSPEDWPVPSQDVVRATLGTEYWSTYFPDKLAPIGSVFTDVGCDRKCDFCQTPEYKLGYKSMSPAVAGQWLKSQKDGGAGSVIGSSDQFLARLLWDGGRDDILQIMQHLRDLDLGILWANGLELRKATRGRGFSKSDTDLSPDEELIQALWGWDGTRGCYHAFIPAERPLQGRENYAKLLPWREHCELLKAIVRTGVPTLTYGCIIGFEDDDDRALNWLEEAVWELYEALLKINPQLYFQIAPFSLSPIPGTPQGRHFRESGLLRFEDPEIFGGIWVPCADTRHLSYADIADWQQRLLKIGAGGGKSQFMDTVFKV